MLNPIAEQGGQVEEIRKITIYVISYSYCCFDRLDRRMQHPRADAYAHQNADRGAHLYPHAHSHTIANPDRHADGDHTTRANSHTVAHADLYSHADGHTVTDADTDTHRGAHADGHSQIADHIAKPGQTHRRSGAAQRTDALSTTHGPRH